VSPSLPSPRVIRSVNRSDSWYLGMRLRTLLTGFLLLASRMALATDLPLVVSLSFRPDHAVPKELPDLILRVTNTSQTTVTLPKLAFEVTDPDGHAFVPIDYAGQSLVDWRPEHEQQRVLQPGQTREFVFPRSLNSPTCFCDVRSHEPGIYRFRAFLGDFVPLGEESPRSIQHLLGEEDYAASNLATFTVDKPKGQDAGAWSLLHSLGEKGCAWQFYVGERIESEYPKSRYAAWQVQLKMGDSPDVNIGRLQQAIARDPNGFMADWHRLRIAEQYDSLMDRSLPDSHGGDLSRALAANEQYKAVLLQLTSSTNSGVAFEARTRLQVASTRQDLERYYRAIDDALHAISTPHLQPLVDCVVTDGRYFDARFAYSSSRQGTVSIPVGDTNKFTPGPDDRGQSTKFKPGGERWAFSVKHLEGQLTWSLDGKQATASLDSRRCDDESDKTASSQSQPREE
jgi:hypothetical protein